MVRDSVQLETAVNTISHEYLLEFTSEYGIPEMLHPELPGPGDRIVDFPEGKVGVYTRFLEFAKFRLLLSQFLFDVLGYYQIHLSQLSVIGAAKVSHFEINCRVLNIIPTMSLFRVFYTPSFNSGWMPFSKRPGKITPQCYTKPLDSLKNWNNRFFWVDERVFPTVMDWRTNASKDGIRVNGTYSVETVRALDTHRTPIQKQPEMLLCLVGISRRYYLGDEVNVPIQFDSCPKSYKGEDWEPPPCPHKVPLLTLTASRVIEMDELAVATDSFGVPSAIEKSSLDFAHEDGASNQGTAAPEMPPPEDVPATAAPGLLRRDHADLRPSGSSHGGKSLSAMQLCLASNVFVSEGAPTNVSDPDPLSFADAPSHHPVDVALSSPGVVAAEDPESENASSSTEVGSPGSVYRLEWGVTNGNLLDTPEACQDLMDHVAPPGYFSELRHMRNKDFLGQYNVARRDKRIEARELEIKNLEALLETEADMKRATEDKSDGMIKELEDMRARFSDLQVSHGQLSQQVASLKEQVSEKEKLKAAFKQLKQYEDEWVDHRRPQVGRRARAAPYYDELEGLKDAPMDVIMPALYLESDTVGDAPQYIRDLRPSSSQLTILVYPEVRDPRNPWAYKEEIKLSDAIAANISHAEKKKKCCIVCRTHGVGSAHHARSDGIPVSVPTVVPQGLALLLVDAATQTDLEDA
nr:hypothetical protein [Tanacetum cinerariifolium]